jgi:hypothetical protein
LPFVDVGVALDDPLGRVNVAHRSEAGLNVNTGSTVMSAGDSVEYNRVT